MLVALAVGSVTERLTLTRDESKVLEFIESIRNTQVAPHAPRARARAQRPRLRFCFPGVRGKGQPVCRGHPAGRGGGTG